MKASQMLLRRKIAFAVCATALTAPVLSSCGFDYATDQPYTQGAGTNNHDTRLKVVGAVVVAGQDDAGTFVAGLANSLDDTVSVTGLTGADANAEFDPIEIPGNGYINLADEDVHVTGSFAAGDVLDLTVEADDGTEIALEVPVVTDCDEFAGYDTTDEATAASEEDPAYSCEYAESESGH